MKKISFLLIAALTVTLFSCSVLGDKDDDAVPQINDEYYTFKVDGVPHDGTETLGFTESSRPMFHCRIGDTIGLVITFPMRAEGTWTNKEVIDYENMTLSYYNPLDTKERLRGYSTGFDTTYTMTIAKYDAELEVIEGTFSAVLMNGMRESVELTEGKFKVQLK